MKKMPDALWSVYNVFGLKMGICKIEKSHYQWIMGFSKRGRILFCNGTRMSTYSSNSKILEEIENQPHITFNVLNEEKESINNLIIRDVIHFRLEEFIYQLLKIILSNKERDQLSVCPEFSDLSKLINPTENTILKFLNLVNIVTSTEFSRNLIKFEIDFMNDGQKAQINFEYPLYDILISAQDNVICGISFEDDEIKLFIQIYKKYIINIMNNLIKNPICIPEKSNQYPHFYALIVLNRMILKIFIKYKIKLRHQLSYSEFLSQPIYDRKVIENLNEIAIEDDSYTKEAQKLDKELYQNEMRNRKLIEPDWFLYNGVTMKNKIEVITQEQINEKLKKEYMSKYQKKLFTLLLNGAMEACFLHPKQMKFQSDLEEILNMQKTVLTIVNNSETRLWFDIRTNKYNFRSDANGEIAEYDKKGITTILNSAIQKNYFQLNIDSSSNVIEVVLVETIDDIIKKKLKDELKSPNVFKILLFSKNLPTINDDVFDINFRGEIFQSYGDLFFKRNRFVPTEYLKKKYIPGYQQLHYNQGKGYFIEKFIFYLVKEDKEIHNYVINWLAYYIKHLTKTQIALVFIGDQEATQNIFWDLIIREIFGKRYCSTINDDEYETTCLSEIAKDKLFFNIGDIDDANTKFDDKVLAKIIKELLIRTEIKDNDNIPVTLRGQIIVTAKNPAPYLKKSLSKCTVIEVNDLETIIKKLDLEDEAELEDKILKDLYSFTEYLLGYFVSEDIATKKFDTEARKILKDDNTSNDDKDEIDEHINDFIEAIKTKNLKYFENIKSIDDGRIYEHLKNAFKQDYFIGQDLLEYYNKTNKSKFKKKKILMDRLKEKDDMFVQEVKTLKILKQDGEEEILFNGYKTSKEMGNKELYKIDDYKLSKHIIIPFGATVISSQVNIKKYAFEDIKDVDACIKRTTEYRKKKK